MSAIERYAEPDGPPSGEAARYARLLKLRDAESFTWFRKRRCGGPARPAGRCPAGRSAVLLVPSVVARMEENLPINPAHPDAAAVRAGLERPVWWDRRLLAG